MKRLSPIAWGLLVATWLGFGLVAQAEPRHSWYAPSPDHEQTFAFGTETKRAWTQRGDDRHLVLLLNFTNDPYVDRSNPRMYDNFSFSFPNVTLGKDGRTFYFRSPEGRTIPVAVKRPDFFGVDEIHLLPNAGLIINMPHGYLSLALRIRDHAEIVDVP